ncbi:MAG: hypothetical protein ACREPI_06975 [Candidatus Dormibacterales bacterium]
MGKKRIQSQQVRRQVRQVRPKAPPPATPKQQKRQRRRYVESGGVLQGYAPERVIRLGQAAAVLVAVLFLIALELALGPISPRGLPVKIVAAVAWVFPIVLVTSFLGPGLRLAWGDRKAEPLLIQGQTMGASAVSTSLGLGMLMVKTRGGNEQFLCPPERLAKVPGNVVNVTLTVTPGLRHVRTVSLMGQRMMARPEPPVPSVLRQLRLLPLLTPACLAAAVLVGADVVAFVPVQPDAVHAALVVVGAGALGGAVYGASLLYQRRLMAAVQALVPGAAG